jgi:phosphoglycerate dehydrogenase-like enzyme
MTRVAVLDDYQGRAHELADWSSLGSEVEVSFFHAPIDRSALAGELAPFDVLVLMRERTALPRTLIEQLPKLRLVVTTGMSNASIDMACLHEREIAVAGTQGGGNAPVEIAWALIFAVTKRLLIEDRAIRDGSWQLGFPLELEGATLGLAGLGRLGSGMVAAARAFRMDVIAWSQNLTDERAAEVGVRKVTKEELLRESDVLSIHLVLSDRTRGLFQAQDLAAMKPGAVLINTSRGPIVDESALVDALRTKAISAGLDVFDVEPLPDDHPLLSLENVVLSPHLGYVSERNFRSMYEQAVENIAGFLNDGPVRRIGP